MHEARLPKLHAIPRSHTFLGKILGGGVGGYKCPGSPRGVFEPTDVCPGSPPAPTLNPAPPLPF